MFPVTDVGFSADAPPDNTGAEQVGIQACTSALPLLLSMLVIACDHLGPLLEEPLHTPIRRGLLDPAQCRIRLHLRLVTEECCDLLYFFPVHRPVVIAEGPKFQLANVLSSILRLGPL